MSRLVCVLILSFGFHLLFAQQTYFLKGKVIDVDSKTPIPYASVAISDLNIGTACDEQGFFELKLPSIYATKKLCISSIGFFTEVLNIDSLIKADATLFALKSDVTLLSEVDVVTKAITPPEIVEGAINSFKNNYYGKPFNLDLYSTISNYDSAAQSTYKLETVLTGYYSGYKTGSTKKFKLLQKKETGTDPLIKAKYKYWPSNELYSVDLITSPFSIGVFNKANWHKFAFKREDISVYDQDTVFVISYSVPKPTSNITGYGMVPRYYRGKLYITIKTNAVVRHLLETDHFTYDIIYRKIANGYFPYIIRGTRENNLKMSGGKRSIVNYNTIIVTDIRFTDLKTIDSKENEWDASLVPFDPGYWNVNYPRK